MSCTQEDARKISNWNTFKALNHLILTSLSEMGDGSLVLELIWNNLSYEIVSFPKGFPFTLFHNNPIELMLVCLTTGTETITT
jgi:pre-rRNA-processing protein IPI1